MVLFKNNGMSFKLNNRMNPYFTQFMEIINIILIKIENLKQELSDLKDLNRL